MNERIKLTVEGKGGINIKNQNSYLETLCHLFEKKRFEIDKIQITYHVIDDQIKYEFTGTSQTKMGSLENGVVFLISPTIPKPNDVWVYGEKIE